MSQVRYLIQVAEMSVLLSEFATAANCLLMAALDRSAATYAGKRF